MRISKSTERGEHTSLNFHIACTRNRLLIARPAIDCGYDVIVHNPITNGMWRVQVKTAQPLKGGRYWVGSTHRRRGERYSPGLIQRFVFASPDREGFWIIDGERFEGRTGRGLTDKYWNKWDLFDVQSELHSSTARLTKPDSDS